jgi:hypothetical protein
LKYFEKTWEGADLLGKTRENDWQLDGVRIGENGVASGAATSDDCRMTAKQWERAKAEYLSGKEWQAIASDLSVPINTLRSRACREGVTKVKAQMQTVCIEKKAQSLEALSVLVRNRLAADAASTLERIDSYDLDGIKDESLREGVLSSVAKRSALVFGWSEQGEQASVSINLLGSMPDRSSVEVNVNESRSSDASSV